MASTYASLDLTRFLEQNCKKIQKPRMEVLFRHGERAFGMFLVLSGEVSLDLGTGQKLSYGPGALIGLPATLSKRNYTMTATVSEDAELGFLAPQVLDSMLHSNPDLCRELLIVLNERMLEIQQVQRALLSNQ